MADCDCPPAPKCPAGIPAWVLTFADLMSLLLAFFVLLFSFSEMDQQKYKQVAGSMRDAFGIQREINIKDPPKGINIIAQEFSAGKPDESTPLNELRQVTTDDFRQYLEIPKPTKEFEEALKEEKERIQLALANEIEDGFVEVDIIDETIVIRILESGSFASASASLIEPFKTLLEKMAKTIGSNPGSVVVAGHTDSKPISNSHFRSNWELSASRAVTVVHELMREGGIPKNRFRIEGYGEIMPVDTNDTLEGRARNRRVEVTLLYDDAFGTVQPAAEDIAVDAMPVSLEESVDAKGVAEPEPEPEPEPETESEPETDESTSPMESILINPCPGCDAGER